MAEQQFSIEFGGYWREEKKGSIPAKSGIYCVYTCTYNQLTDKVSIQKLIYIGESANVNGRVANHPRLADWKKHLQKGDTLCYSFGAVPSDHCVRCEAAMIFHHKPPENTEYRDAFPHDKTTLTLSGVIAFLREKFTVNRTP
jgi:hypothetical protein